MTGRSARNHSMTAMRTKLPFVQSLHYISLEKPTLSVYRDLNLPIMSDISVQDQPNTVENRSLRSELDSALEREAATREILQVISQSRDDDQPVFDVILRNAARLCDAPMARLELANEARSHFSMAAAWGDESRSFSLGETFPLDLPHVTPTSIREGRSIHIEDLADTPEFLAGDPIRVRAVTEEGLRTYLTIPLISGGLGIGCIVLSRREVSPFDGNDIALLETFAAQAVIAIENVRQFREVQTRLEREAATGEILQVISQSRSDTGPVFDAIIENASRLCKAPLAFLSIADEARTRVTIPAALGERAQKILTRFDQPIDATHLIAVRPIVDGKVIHIADCSDTELYRKRDPYRVSLVEVEGIRTILAVPMISNGISLGAILLYRREVKLFDADQIELAKTFADQAAIAIENVRQFNALEARTAEVQALNAGLESRVEQQVGEIERMGRLKRFLSPQVADAVLSSGNEKLLSSHRALLGILFCDIRGFTGFCEMAEPEETIEVLQTYHEQMGALIAEHSAGVDTRAGDGIMVIFNDPLPCDDPAGDALRLGLAMRERMEELCKGWRRHGHKLGFGVGISLGYATVGMVGSEGRYDYTASGTAVNLAARLCDKAGDGEILLSPRAYSSVEEKFTADAIGELSLKGIHEPVEVFKVSGEK